MSSNHRRSHNSRSSHRADVYVAWYRPLDVKNLITNAFPLLPISSPPFSSSIDLPKPQPVKQPRIAKQAFCPTCSTIYSSPLLSLCQPAKLLSSFPFLLSLILTLPSRIYITRLGKRAPSSGGDIGRSSRAAMVADNALLLPEARKMSRSLIMSRTRWVESSEHAKLSRNITATKWRWGIWRDWLDLYAISVYPRICYKKKKRGEEKKERRKGREERYPTSEIKYICITINTTPPSTPSSLHDKSMISLPSNKVGGIKPGIARKRRTTFVNRAGEKD